MLFHQKKYNGLTKKSLFLDVFVPNGWDINDVIRHLKNMCVFSQQGTFHFYHKKPEAIQTFSP